MGVKDQKTFVIKTFGCKTNQIDSEKTAALLTSCGWRASAEEPEMCVVNSCCVTERSEKKVLRAAKKIKKRFPSSKVVLSGCITGDLKKAAETCGISSVANFIAGENQGIPHAAGFPRYFLKIQNGCNNFCSYCIVPYLRGRSGSFDFNDLIRELEDVGAPAEVVISGTNIMDYRWGGLLLIDLLREISERFTFRIRLSSLSLPFEKNFVGKISRIQGISPHFHLPLQSGSPSILRKMFRKYSVGQFIETVKEIREYFKNPAITTDVIFGFPGETDEDFEATLNVIKKVGFSKVHIFPYSPRRGTPAYLYKCLPSHKMEQRKRRILEEAEKSSTAYKRKFIEKELSVVVEKRENDFFYGTSENYLKVKFKGAAGTLPGRVARVSVTGTEGRFLSGVEGRHPPAALIRNAEKERENE
ncbi:MAG: radical SAM protein [bacterium]